MVVLYDQSSKLFNTNTLCKNDDLAAEVDVLIENYGAWLGINPARRARDVVETAVREAGEALQDQINQLKSRVCTEEVLNDTKTTKLYPRGIANRDKHPMYIEN